MVKSPGARAEFKSQLYRVAVQCLSDFLATPCLSFSIVEVGIMIVVNIPQINILRRVPGT